MDIKKSALVLSQLRNIELTRMVLKNTLIARFGESTVIKIFKERFLSMVERLIEIIEEQKLCYSHFEFY